MTKIYRLMLVTLITFAPTTVLGHPAFGVVCTDGRIFFSDLGRETIWSFEDDELTAFPVERHLHRVHLDAEGRPIFDHQDGASASLWRLDPGSGEISPLAARKPMSRSAFDLFDDGTSLLTGRDGSSLGVARIDTGIELIRRSATGIVERIASYELETEGLHFVQAKTLGLDGSVLLTAGGRVHRLGIDGEHEPVGGVPFAGVEGSSMTIPIGDRLLGLVDSPAGVIVADYGRSAVRLVEAGGEVRTLYRSGFGWAPSGVARCAGSTIVLEVRSGLLFPLLKNFGGPRILSLEEDGPRVLATVEGHRALWLWPIALALSLPFLYLIRRWRRGG